MEVLAQTRKGKFSSYLKESSVGGRSVGRFSQNLGEAA